MDGYVWSVRIPQPVVYAARLVPDTHGAILPPLSDPMPYTVSVDPASRRALIVVIGTLTGAEIIAACREVFTHPDWRGGFSTLWDANALRALVLLPDDVASFAAAASELTPLRGDGRSAMVTWDPSVHINALLLCLKSKGAHDREFRVFGRREAAEAWLAEESVSQALDVAA